MDDTHLEGFNLQPICETVTDCEDCCYNTLRFTDLEDSTKIYPKDSPFPGIDNMVDCKFLSLTKDLVLTDLEHIAYMIWAKS